MGMADHRPSQWHVSFSARAKGMSADLQVRSSCKAHKKGLFSFFSTRKKTSSSSNHHVLQQAGGCLTTVPASCDISLRIRAHFFLLRVRVAAGRLHELGLQTLRPGKLTRTRAFCQNSIIKPVSSPPRSHVLKGLFGWSSSVLSRLLFAKKQRKGSAFACSAGLGAFVLLILHHARTWATHLPAFARNAGSSVISFLVKSLRQKCANGASPFWQDARNLVTLFQMALSIIRSTLVMNRFLTTALLIAVVGLVMMGKANKLQELLDKRQRTGANVLPARLLMRLLMAMKLVRSFWAQISLVHVFIFVLLSAILSNGISWVDKLF